jgi:hypothetical protein
MSNTSPLKRLQMTCTVTLDRYMELAKGTCEMLGTLRALPVSKDRRLEIVLQKKRERKAQVSYEKASLELLSALQLQTDLSDATPIPAPRPQSRRAPRLEMTKRLQR